ncbi:MAG: N-acetylmuramoyl-L-alanine amidase [Calditrichaeota bacterium]|nr:MAG: N-acetylmuramoyl-L-alanine amidase [Calditrichota bacterium]
MKVFSIQFLSAFVLWAGVVIAGDLNQLPVISKKEWGGAPVASDADTASYHQTPGYITVHHGGVFFAPDKDPVAYLKHLQTFSTDEKGWMDIPYHFLIDPAGKIYAARPLRFAGDTNTEYDPHGHALICMIGNYEVQKVHPAQLTALIDLILALMHDYHIGPEKVATHRDYSRMTVCPGKDLYRYFQDGWIYDMLKSRSHWKKAHPDSVN